MNRTVRRPNVALKVINLLNSSHKQRTLIYCDTVVELKESMESLVTLGNKMGLSVQCNRQRQQVIINDRLTVDFMSGLSSKESSHSRAGLQYKAVFLEEQSGSCELSLEDMNKLHNVQYIITRLRG